MSSRKIYACGCRKATANRKGHRPTCPYYDPERYDSHVTRRDRRLTSYRHAARNAERFMRVVAHN